MRKEKTLFILGLWIITLQFLGFPNSWDRVFLILTGLAIMYLAYLFYLEVKARLSKSKDHGNTFVDNIGSGE